MSRQPRFEVVRSDAGWFARFVAANGQKVWQTEVYERRRAAERAIKLAGDTHVCVCRDATEVRWVDER